MRKKSGVLIINIIFMMLFSSCSGNKINPDIQKTGLDKLNLQRIKIINNRSAQVYSIVNESSESRFKNYILKAASVSHDSKLEPDFTFELYSGAKIMASFKYIAGITDKGTANLIDEDGHLYYVDDSIEDAFIKRMIQTKQNDSITKYYIALIDKVLEKIDSKPGDTIVVDITKDYIVTSSLISVNQKRIIDGIGSNGVTVVYPGETTKWDYYITINTTSFSSQNGTAKAVAAVKNKNNVTVNYDVQRTYNGDFFIKFK